jgi:hypothetical protein
MSRSSDSDANDLKYAGNTLASFPYHFDGEPLREASHRCKRASSGDSEQGIEVAGILFYSETM